VKRVNLAMQGGGAHGAFGWGILDRLVEDERLDIEGLSASSSGSMNAVVYAAGRMRGGRAGAREALEKFWRSVSVAGMAYMPGVLWFQNLSGAFSPAQLNPFGLNPLRDLVKDGVDLDAVRACTAVELFLCATNVGSGQPRIFRNAEITLDVLMASACLPSLFPAVEIGGQHYWDGGYMGNPALYPLIYNTVARDIVIVHINPIVRPQVPRSAAEIQNRLNEITFNSSLLRELRAIAFVTKLIEQGWLKEQYQDKLKHVLIHSIRADAAMSDLGVSSKLNTDWGFLCELRDRGRDAAAAWLQTNFEHLGERSTVDLQSEFLASPALSPSAGAG